MKQIVLYLICLLFVLSCSKGPTGPAGVQGPAGPTGPAGSQGPSGTANVIYSAAAYATNFRDSIIDNSEVKLADLAAASLTSDDLQSATILVYFTYGSGYFPLPYTSFAGGLENTISFIPETGKILITRFTANNSNSVGLSTLLQYRFVIIPGGVSVPDRYDYEGTLRYLGVPLN